MSKIAPYTTVLTAITAIVIIVLEKGYAIGVPVIIFFISLAISLRTSAMFKGLSFTVLIFAAVSTPLFYPSILSEIGGLILKDSSFHY